MFLFFYRMIMQNYNFFFVYANIFANYCNFSNASFILRIASIISSSLVA